MTEDASFNELKRQFQVYLNLLENLDNYDRSEFAFSMLNRLQGILDFSMYCGNETFYKAFYEELAPFQRVSVEIESYQQKSEKYLSSLNKEINVKLYNALSKEFSDYLFKSIFEIEQKGNKFKIKQAFNERNYNGIFEKKCEPLVFFNPDELDWVRRCIIRQHDNQKDLDSYKFSDEFIAQIDGEFERNIEKMNRLAFQIKSYTNGDEYHQKENQMFSDFFRNLKTTSFDFYKELLKYIFHSCLIWEIENIKQGAWGTLTTEYY